MVDWSAIKTEYVTTDTSYRKLCDKYGVSMTEVSRHGKEEEWRKERKKYQEKAYAKIRRNPRRGQHRQEAKLLQKAV